MTFHAIISFLAIGETASWSEPERQRGCSTLPRWCSGSDQTHRNFGVGRKVGYNTDMVKLIMKWLFALAFIGVGVAHFIKAEFFVRIMPPYLPWHLELVYISGVCEIALGVLLLIPKFSRLAAWGLIALLIAVFPANVHMALHTEEFSQYSPAVLWGRLPLQGVLIVWAYWFTRGARNA